MSKKKVKRISIQEFANRFATEEACRDYLAEKRWPDGFICPECGCERHCVLSNGLYQCAECHRQTSVTAGTFMHRSHLKLKTWFFALYFVTQDKRGISATQLASSLGINYKSAWRMLKKIRTAMGKRDENHVLSGIIEFDDTYIGGPTVGKKRGRGTEKAKVFVALSLKNGAPEYLKMKVTENICKESVKSFAEQCILSGATVKTDACRCYIPALKDYNHQYEKFDPNSGNLQWLHTITSNAKAFILGTYHGLPKMNLQEYLNEFCYRFSRRWFGGALFDRLALAMTASPSADLKG